MRTRIALIAAALGTTLAIGCNDTSKELPGGYLLTVEAGSFTYIDAGSDALSIPCNVVDLDYDEFHIVVVQEYATGCPLMSGVPDQSGAQLGDVFYWIIEVKPRRLHGPYGHKEFGAARSDLDVSTSLRVGSSR